MFVCPSYCHRAPQCLSMLGPLPTSPMATPRCWQTNWLWSWLDGMVLWVRAHRAYRSHSRAKASAWPQNLGMTDNKMLSVCLGVPDVERFKAWSALLGLNLKSNLQFTAVMNFSLLPCSCDLWPRSILVLVLALFYLPLASCCGVLVSCSCITFEETGGRIAKNSRGRKQIDNLKSPWNALE